MACQDTSALEISALMPSPAPRQICWLDGAGVYCKGTIWRSSMQLESQCASFISLCFQLTIDSRITRRVFVEWKSFFFCNFFAEIPQHSTSNSSRDFHTQKAPLGTVHGLVAVGLLENRNNRREKNSELLIVHNEQRIFCSISWLLNNKKNRIKICVSKAKSVIFAQLLFIDSRVSSIFLFLLFLSHSKRTPQYF